MDVLNDTIVCRFRFLWLKFANLDCHQKEVKLKKKLDPDKIDVKWESGPRLDEWKMIQVPSPYVADRLRYAKPKNEKSLTSLRVGIGIQSQSKRIANGH